MSTKGRQPRRRPQVGVAYSREFLERLARILVRSGHSPAELIHEFRDICGRLKEPAHPWDPAQLTYVADITHVIARWFADPQYVDSRGAPLALPMRGRGPSVFSLIGRALPAEDPAQVFRSLQTLRGIRRRGRFYVPVGRYLPFNAETASVRVHALRALLGILRTVEHNISGNRADTIPERAAMNPSFPVSALPAFYRWLKVMATELLWSVDEKMRRYEDSSVPGPRIRVGVDVFAFEDPILRSSRPGKNRTIPGKGRRRRGRSA